MSPDDTRAYRAMGYLAANPSAVRIFRAVTDQIGATGWQVARLSNHQPREVEAILGELLQINLVRADGPGLDAYYLPTREAYIFGRLT